jgi:uncharacterized oxidoreductase
MRLEGNAILITGGASGIGFELAKELVKRKNTVAITGRDQGKLDRAKQQAPELHVFQSDVSNPADIASLHDRVLAALPNLNVLVNNAGVMRAINVHKDEGSLEDFTREIDINFTGPVRMVRQFLPHLKKMSSAAIINVSSGLAFVPLPIAPVYCATKAAMHSFSLSLRVQLKKSSVKVFEIAPPTTQTEMLGSFDSSDMEGVPIMKVEELVRLSIKGIERDEFEIRPGQSNQLRFMNRLAPNFILAQLSKPVERMLKE